MSQPKFDQHKLDMEEMNLVLRGLEWSYKDKNNPDGIREKMRVLHGKLENYLHRILDQLD